MIVDPSVLVAILLKETDADELSRRLWRADVLRMSTASFLEAGIVLDQRANLQPDDPVDTLVELLRTARIELVPFTEDHARIARIAYRRYGRKRHPAGLNFGDCMSYALAKSLDEPLLFKGTDFSLTDVRVAE
jgi:ribonuclease VapC